MKLTMLGSGGVHATPRPTCTCRYCVEAREKGIPYARTGCSLFVHDGNILFDTAEEVRAQLNRERVAKVESVVLTHWHPDHTHGIRILEVLNWNFAAAAPFGAPIPVYMSVHQQQLFREYSCGKFLDHYRKKGMIEIRDLVHKQPLPVAGITVTPFLIDHTKGFYFLLEQPGKRVVYLPCEYHHVSIDPAVRGVDLFIAHNLFWENPAISPRKRKPTDEDSFEKMLRDATEMQAKRIVLTHIEESFQLGHDELNAKLKEHYGTHDVTAGFDGQIFTL